MQGIRSCLLLSLTCLSHPVPRTGIVFRCCTRLVFRLWSLRVRESMAIVCFSVCVTECECAACRCKIETSSPSWRQQWPCPPLLPLLAAPTFSFHTNDAMPPSPVASLSRMPTSARAWATRSCRHLPPYPETPRLSYGDLGYTWSTCAGVSTCCIRFPG